LHRLQIALLALLVALVGGVGTPASAAREATDAATAWRLLDYIAVDYPGAVSAGKIVSPAEYAEMVEFSRSVGERISVLPATPAKPVLARQAEELNRAVAAKDSADRVGGIARALGRDLLRAYPVPLAPSTLPDLSRAASIYRQQCAACHGLAGRGDGPSAAGLDPPPVAFTNLARARERSVFSLYQVINQGLDGTAMSSFAHLDTADQWALAFHVGAFAFSEADARRGEALWRADSSLRQRFPDMEALTQITPAKLAQEVGEERSRALVAFLRRTPEGVTTGSGGALDTARARLLESVQAYASGDQDRASDLALSAYLDGFEPLEPVLSVRDAGLLARVERSMGDLRAAIARGAPPADVGRRVDELNSLFDEADGLLATRSGSWISSFVGALMILLREGLEALLIIVAMVAFLRKADRNEVLPYVHGGWLAALVAGVATWFAATRLIAISGASRELTEGFGSLLAAAVLVSVGVWMHGKGQAGAWQRYVKERLASALSRRSAWFLFLLAFVVVYREAFETILFLTALWAEGGATGILAGVGTAAMILAIVAMALLRYSRRLPIAEFFKLSSLLIAALAIVLAGKGVAGLQEAGLLGVWPLEGLPRVAMLGIYPTREGLFGQIATLAVLLVGYWFYGRIEARKAHPAAI
jgi:high-affinity iron transporter